MTVQIPLKRKYLRGFKSRHAGGERAAPPKRRVKIGYKKHADRYGEPPAVYLHIDGKTGKGTFHKVAP